MTDIGPLADTLADHYGVGLAVVGLLTTAVFVAQVLTLVPCGRLVDVHGTKRAALIAMSVAIAANLLLLLPLGFAPAMAFRFVVGVAVGAAFVAGTSYVPLAGGGPVALGIYGGAAVGGGGLALTTIPLLEPALGWRTPFATAIFASVVASAVIASRPSPPRAGRRQDTGSVISLLREPTILSFGAIHTATFGIGVVLSNWIVTLLDERGGIDDSIAGLVGGLIMGTTIVGRPVGGWIVRRNPPGARRLLVSCILTGAAMTAVLGLGSPLALMFAAALGIGVAASLPFSAMITSLTRIYAHAPAAAVGGITVWASTVILIATPLVGVTFDLPGDGLIGFEAMAAVWIAALVLMPGQAELVPDYAEDRVVGPGGAEGGGSLAVPVANR